MAVRPVQVKILTITDRSDEAAKELQQLLLAANLRPELDLRNEKIGFKVREAQMQKIPYMFVLGDREAEDKTVTIRNRKGDNVGTVPFAEAVAMIKSSTTTRPWTKGRVTYGQSQRTADRRRVYRRRA